jgi:hypothetical protein
MMLEEEVARAICKAHYGLSDTSLCHDYEERRWSLFLPKACAVLPIIEREKLASRQQAAELLGRVVPGESIEDYMQRHTDGDRR